MGLQECVIDVCLHLCSCRNVYVCFHFLDVFNVVTKSFFISTPLYKQFQGQKNSRQKSKIFLEDRSDRAITMDSKTKRKERQRK